MVVEAVHRLTVDEQPTQLDGTAGWPQYTRALVTFISSAMHASATTISVWDGSWHVGRDLRGIKSFDSLQTETIPLTFEVYKRHIRPVLSLQQ